MEHMGRVVYRARNWSLLRASFLFLFCTIALTIGQSLYIRSIWPSGTGSGQALHRCIHLIRAQVTFIQPRNVHFVALNVEGVLVHVSPRHARCHLPRIAGGAQRSSHVLVPIPSQRRPV